MALQPDPAPKWLSPSHISLGMSALEGRLAGPPGLPTSRPHSEPWEGHAEGPTPGSMLHHAPNQSSRETSPPSGMSNQLPAVGSFPSTNPSRPSSLASPRPWQCSVVTRLTPCPAPERGFSGGRNLGSDQRGCWPRSHGSHPPLTTQPPGRRHQGGHR